jgi:hypothetical protein
MPKSSDNFTLSKNEWCRCLYCLGRPQFDSLDELAEHVRGKHPQMPVPGWDWLPLYMLALVSRKPADMRIEKNASGENELRILG